MASQNKKIAPDSADFRLKEVSLDLFGKSPSIKVLVRLRFNFFHAVYHGSFSSTHTSFLAAYFSSPSINSIQWWDYSLLSREKNEAKSHKSTSRSNWNYCQLQLREKNSQNLISGDIFNRKSRIWHHITGRCWRYTMKIRWENY